MRYLYTLILYCLTPLILIRLWLRSIKAPLYRRRWAERFGFFSPLVTTKKVVWLHTVSVGEFLAATPLIKQLLANNQLQLVITTTTPTGSERVKAVLGDSVFHCYAPYDLPDTLARFLARIKPQCLIVMETELWPNLLAACKKRNIPSVLINARMSEKSARGYQRFGALTRPMLASLAQVAAQTEADAQRLIALGLPETRVQITGNIKFDLELLDDLRVRAGQLKQQLSAQGNRVVIVAASTHEGEDQIILNAYAAALKELGSDSLFLVLVPRHPERFNQVVSLSKASGFITCRRTSSGECESAQVMIGDTMGELMLLLGAGDIVFMGGSLVARGGHNFIEPAAWGLPLISGTHLFNFVEVSRLLREVGALELVEGEQQLAAALVQLAKRVELRLERGQAALKVAKDNRGALARTMAVLNHYI